MEVHQPTAGVPEEPQLQLHDLQHVLPRSGVGEQESVAGRQDRAQGIQQVALCLGVAVRPLEAPFQVIESSAADELEGVVIAEV